MGQGNRVVKCHLLVTIVLTPVETPLPTLLRSGTNLPPPLSFSPTPLLTLVVAGVTLVLGELEVNPLPAPTLVLTPLMTLLGAGTKSLPPPTKILPPRLGARVVNSEPAGSVPTAVDNLAPRLEANVTDPKVPCKSKLLLTVPLNPLCRLGKRTVLTPGTHLDLSPLTSIRRLVARLTLRKLGTGTFPVLIGPTVIMTVKIA